MKTLFMVFALLLAFVAADEGSIDGVWITEKKDSKIEISYNPDSGTYSGKIIWAAAPYQGFEGEFIIKGITYKKDSDSYSCPWVYDPRLEVTARGTATISGDTLYLKARKGIFTKNQIFTRVK